jgi:mRNA interferase RelE/StbE
MSKVLYQLRYRQSVAKELRGMPHTERGRVVAKIQGLVNNPYPVGAVKLRGATGLYRIRQGEYRVVYQVENQELIILVVKIGHRREVYRGV